MRRGRCGQCRVDCRRGVERVPVAKGLRRRDTGCGHSDDAGGGGQIGEGVDLFSMTKTENGSADEEEWDVGSDGGGNSEALGEGQTRRLGEVGGKFSFQGDERSGGIGGTGAQAALDGKAFLDMNGDGGMEAKGGEGLLHHAPRGVALVSGYAGMVAGENDLRGRRCVDRDRDQVVLVVQFESLIQSYEGVVSVGTGGANGETKVDLGV
jgi:hypothetical protein